MKKSKEKIRPVVTDHALIRYIERVLGYDLEAVKALILTPDRIKMIEAGAMDIRGDGYVLKIKNGTVITVIKT